MNLESFAQQKEEKEEEKEEERKEQLARNID